MAGITLTAKPSVLICIIALICLQGPLLSDNDWLLSEELFALFDSSICLLIHDLLLLRPQWAHSRLQAPLFDRSCYALCCDIRWQEWRYRRTRDPDDCLIWLRHLRLMRQEFRAKEMAYLEWMGVTSRPGEEWSVLVLVFALQCTQPFYHPYLSIYREWLLWLQVLKDIQKVLHLLILLLHCPGFHVWSLCLWTFFVASCQSHLPRGRP